MSRPVAPALTPPRGPRSTLAGAALAAALPLALLLPACADGAGGGRPEAGPRRLGHRVERAGTSPGSPPVPAPVLLPARQPSEGREVSGRLSALGAAEIVAGWNAYAERSLVVAVGASVAHAGYRPEVREVRIERAGGGQGLALVVEVAVRRTGGFAAQVVSTPWVALSVDAGDLAGVQECRLTMGGETGISPC